MSSIRSAVRNHLHFIVIVSVLLVVMTWPTIVYVFDTETFWLPTSGKDVFSNIWDAWHGRLVFAGEAPPYYTNMLFYPTGLSLVYNPNNLIQRTLLWMFQYYMGTSNAFNLIYLLIIATTSVSAYIYFNYLYKDRWLALFGAVVFGFSQHVVGHPNHPMVNLLSTIPLSLYALQRGIEEEKWQWFLLSGVLVGITAFIGLYVFVCLLLTLLLFFICFTYSNWRLPRFWSGTVIMFVVAGLVSLLHIFPMIRDASKLEEALNKNLGEETGNDLLSYFVSGGHPFLTPVFVEIYDMNARGELNFREQHKTSYLGYLPLLLIALGFSSAKHRRKMLPWTMLLLPFLILRLGSTLLINGTMYPDVLLPKYLLDSILPFIFQAFYEIDHFQIGILLPFSVLSCFGLQVLLKSVPKKYCSLVVIAAVALVAFEYYQPLTSQVIPERQFTYNDWLRNEPNQEEISLINLPMGRSSSKNYGFYQTINGYPHAEGLANRTPDRSYNYILQNFLLAAWHRRGNPDCSSSAFDRYLAAADQLLNDGFSHVILHHGERRVYEVADSFRNIPLAYQDVYVSIYRLSALRINCLERVEGYQNQLPVLKKFLHAPINLPRGDISLMVFYPSKDFSSDSLHPFDIALADWRDLTHVVHDSGSVAKIINADEQYRDLDDIVGENNKFWLIYSSQDSDPSRQSQFATWLNQNLRFCQQIHQGADLIVENYIDRAFPCELVMTENPLKLHYDNGITLANLLTDFDGDQLSVDTWWQRDDINGYAYTIQVFNDGGDKQLQADRVIDSRPLSSAQFDISDLPPGDYVAQLIVYETESGQSQRGTILSTQQIIKREFEIARFSVPA